MRFSGSLKENYMFRRLYNKGATAADSYLVLYSRKNRSGKNRIGLTTGKKLGHAVVRNRVRRRLREIYRLHEEDFCQGLDLVVVARGRSVNATYQTLEHSFLKLAGSLELLREVEEQP